MTLMLSMLGHPALLPLARGLGLTLGQAQPGGSPATRILFWLAVLGASAVFLGVTCFVLWRRLTRDDQAPTVTTGFTLPDLRDLHKAGQLTDEEFENAKAMLLARSRAEMALDDDPAAPADPDVASR